MDHSEELQEMILLLQELKTSDLDVETHARCLPPTTYEDCIHELLMSRQQWSFHREEIEELCQEISMLKINKRYKKYDNNNNKNTKGIGINRHTAMYATIIAQSSDPKSKST